MKLGLIPLAAGVLACLFAQTTPASATPLDGATLSVRVANATTDPIPGTLRQFVVNSAPGQAELVGYGSASGITVDIFDTDSTHARVVFRSTTSSTNRYAASPNLMIFKDVLGTLPPLIDVTLGAVNWPGVTPSDLTFDADSFSVDFGGLRIVARDEFELNLTTGAPVVPGVPDTGSTCVMGAVAIAAVMRFRTRRA